jgi:hypothetical protein
MPLIPQMIPLHPAIELQEVWGESFPPAGFGAEPQFIGTSPSGNQERTQNFISITRSKRRGSPRMNWVLENEAA